ncbi:MAG TPA: PilX N-terminal domain-containing pilus assembly protein [Terriglobales bacterium]|nr:PilX N-terminal domain-containing pilus assembly protein [Terriglobales bacterium]
MKRNPSGHRNGERGIALITVLLALLLLSAIGLGMMYMTNMETSINANFRRQQVAYFAARAGLEEVRARMMKASPNSLWPLITPGSIPTAIKNYDPGMARGPLTFIPTGNNQAILYILNEGNQAGSVRPWDINNQYYDDELCHDGYNLPGLQAQNSIDYSVRCTTLPNGNLWYQTATSTAPWNGTSAALPWKWARVALKLNGSQQNYPVSSVAGAATGVCFNAANEQVLPAGTAQCNDTIPSMNPVFLVTVLAVTTTGARRMVQAEVGLQPTQPFQYGMFATGNTCPSPLVVGGGSTTDAYYSSAGPYGGTNVYNTGGDVGAVSTVTVIGSGTAIGGSVGSVLPAGVGACGTAALNTSQTPLVGNPTNAVCGAGAPTNCIANIATAPIVPTPPPPSPLPPTTNKVYNSNTSLTPGTYGNVTVSGGSTLTLAPGTYNWNSLTFVGNSNIVVSPPGAVVFNFAGTGISSPAKVFDMGGGSLTCAGCVPKDFQVMYGGTAKIALNGGAATFMQVNAPNAAITLSGNGDFYGAILGKSIDVSGGAKFHYDLDSSIVSISNAYFTLLAFRESFY